MATFEENLSKKFNEYFEYCKTKLKEGACFTAPYSTKFGWIALDHATDEELNSWAFEIVYNYLLAGMCPYDKNRAFYDPEEESYYSEGACLLDFSAAEVK